MAHLRSALKASAVLVAGWMAQDAAQARDITFAVIGPSEYDLPADGFRPFDAVVEYVEYDGGSHSFDTNGNRVKSPDTDLLVSLTKYVHFWTFDSMPDVGFAFEVIQPTVHVATPDSRNTGFGDTLVGPAVWIKPTKNTTLGVQSFMSVPVGDNAISNHHWANMTSVLFNAKFDNGLRITGDAGGVFRGKQDVRDGPNIRPGDSYHANLRLSYRGKGSRFEPYLAFDWQKNRESRLMNGDPIPFTSGHDMAMGAGTAYSINDKLTVAARYSRSIEGRNVAATNALYFSISKIF